MQTVKDHVLERENCENKDYEEKLERNLLQQW